MKLRCAVCGRRIGVYIDEVSGRYLAHVIPVAFHRAQLDTRSVGEGEQ